MANPEQLRILRQGSEAWNQWIKRNFSTKIDFKGADLREEYLGEVNLGRADFQEAKLTGAGFVRAYFGEANLQDADLERANLMGSVIIGANLSGVNLANAYLGGKGGGPESLDNLTYRISSEPIR